MKIEILSVEIEDVAKNNKTYKKASVAYKNLDKGGKVEGKNLVDFANRDLFKEVTTVAKGSTLDIKLEKNEASGYWDWKEIVKDNAVATPTKTPGASPAPKSTYETPEERAQRQVYIIRQSSLSNAIETLKTDKNTPKFEEVVDLAAKYEEFVFKGKPVNATQGLMEMDDDVPL